MTGKYETCFLHVDLDAFFASVEQLDHPEYRGKPLIVGGIPGERRSVVSTASYEARKFGVHSAMPIVKAYELCPNGIYVHCRMKRYLELSAQIMDIFRTFSPDVEQMSIDEAFIDLTGTEKLFGDPAGTARRIKLAVKAQTGLTVSVGLASNRYIAKLASELSKPNGFSEIIPGTEESFMLSRPIEKIWGIGDKTRKRIYDAGLKTAYDIHEKSRELLCIMFGNATGNFLYNTVRGRENDCFRHETKIHSISAECTFPYDLTDIYTAETAIMELAHTVMFRLLREEMTSRTVVLKLRYDDFSTMTSQDSSDEIMSTDDFYNRACRLFEKHYEHGRGIRLLGIGAGNAENETVHQEELFDSDSKKKQAVEKAILNLKLKHPDIKISKARLLNNKMKLIAFFITCLYLFTAHRTEAQDTTEIQSSGAGSLVTGTTANPEPDQQPASLFNYTMGNTNVEFLADGYWQSGFTQTTASSFGYSTPFALSFGVPVFQQKVDLSLSFLLNKSWFFDASFADEFTKNTIAAGYYGTGNLKEVKIANRGIIFPSGYSPDLFGKGIGGGENQAPGISAHFEDTVSQKWHADIALRYDMTTQKNATFYGKNSVSATTIQPADYLTGQQFVLPSSDAVTAVKNVYVESSSGSLSDTEGRTYRKLSDSEYMLLPARFIIIISKNAGAIRKNGKLPAVIITFSTESELNTVKSSLGSYGTAANPGTGFLGNIQTFFGSSESDSKLRPDVADYSFAGKTNSNDFITSIGNEKALIIQSPSGFSPFTCACRYDCGLSSTSDVIVASGTTGTASKQYTAVISTDILSFTATDFFSSTHTYADVTISNSEADDLLDPSMRFPFADKNPGCYLGYSESSDLELLVRTYTPVTRYDIGTDAAAGSVRVYKNGIIDSSATYDTESGTVTLSSSVSDSDKIYITWDEDSETADNGAIAAETGFSYQILPGLTSDCALSTRWSISPNRVFADADNAQNGFITLSSGTKYTNESSTDNTVVSGSYSITDAGSASLETVNTTERYRVLGMDDKTTQTYYLSQKDGYDLPTEFVPVLNNRPENSGTLPDLSENANGTTGSRTGEKNSGISGYAVPLEWDFTNLEDSTDWAAESINLDEGSLLSSGTEFHIALKTSEAISSGADIYLQLGVDASSDSITENKTKIPTWKISDSNAPDVVSSFDWNNKNWQTVAVTLRDSDRARFTSFHDARIIIVKKNTTVSSDTGTLYAGPYETAVQSVFLSHDSYYTVATEQYAESTISGVSKFNSGTNYAESIVWRGTDETPPTDTCHNISAARYFSEIDLASYTSVNLFFSYAGGSTCSGTTDDEYPLTIILDNGAESVTENGKIAITAKISKSDFSNKYIESGTSYATTRSWHLLTINIVSRTISIDGENLSSSVVSTVNTSVVPSRLKIVFSTAPGSSIYRTGAFCFDELYLDGASPHFLIQHITKASYKKNGVIAQAGYFPIIENVSLSGSAEQSATIQSQTHSMDSRLDSSATAAATIATIAFSTDASTTSDDTYLLSSAGHSAATTIPIFGVLSLSEIYRFNHADETLDKSNTISVSFFRFHVPVTLSTHVSSSESDWLFKQDSGADFSLSLGDSLWNTIFTAKAGVTQKVIPSLSEIYPDTSNYFSGWKNSTDFCFSTGNSDASLRSSSVEAKLNTNLPFFSLSPSVTMSVNGTYSSSSSIIYTDTTIFKTIIPFKILNDTFSLGWSKEGTGSQLTSKGGNYKIDYDQLITALSSRSWYFSAAPFYDLFSSKLSEAILSDTTLTSESADSLAYSTIYTLSWNRPVFGSLTDFYIPTGITLSTTRDIRTSKKISDIYQFKTVVQQNAFNIFGDESQLRFFHWYKQDEYITSFTGGIKMPRNDPQNFSILVNTYSQSNFYLNDSDILKNGIELNIETDGDWSAEYTISWKRNGVFNPVANIIHLFVNSFNTDTTKLIRTDSADISLSSADSIFKQIYVISHSADLQLFTYFTLNYGISGTCTCTQDSATLLALVLTIGGKAEF
jgi:nucleotidyltransferase/DNA polymerase involved in DNA repair